MVSRYNSVTELEKVGIRHEFAEHSGKDNCCCELRVYSLAHDSLQTQTRTHEAKSNERQGVCPSRIAPGLSDARLTALPDKNGGGHGEKSLDERAEEEPKSGFRSYFITYPTKGSPSDERQYRCQSLLICDVERGVVVPGGAGEESGEGEGQLNRVTGLKATPNEDGSERNGVDESGHKAIRS